MRHRLKATLGPILLAVIAGCTIAGSGAVPMADSSRLGVEDRLRLGSAALRGGNTDGAIGILQQAVHSYPDSALAKRALADAFYTVGAFPEAEQAYTELGRLEGGVEEYRLGVARVALGSGDLPGALTRYETARQARPDDSRAMNGLAVAYDLSGRHPEAQAIYAQLLAKEPANRAVANNLALSLALSGDINSAVKRLSALVYGPTEIPQARHNLALAFGLQGNEDAARALLAGELTRAALEDNIAFYRLARGGVEQMPANAP